MALYVGAFPHPKQPRGCLVIMATLCLAADLLCAEKGREKGGLEEEKDGLVEEEDANKLLRTGFGNRAVNAWLGAAGSCCGSPGLVTPRGGPGDARGAGWFLGYQSHRASLLQSRAPHPTADGHLLG